MKSLHVAAGISTTLIVSAVTGMALNASFAMAQSDASSTVEATSTAEVVDPTASSTTPELPAPVSQPPVATETPLKLVRVTGTKYVDYCSDGTKTIEVPGDPAIDANLHLPDAQTPTCPDGMTWDHTSGMDAFDTETGELEVGSYAKQADGSYVARYPATEYADATSTASWPERVVVTKNAPVTEEGAPAAPEPDIEPPVEQPAEASSTAATSTE